MRRPGTFTTNRVCAAPVKWCRERLPADDIRAIVINSGNANAATGAQGLANARRTAERAAALLGCQPEQVLVASTGIIGHQLPMDKIEAGIARAVAGLSAEPGGLSDRRRVDHDDRHTAQDRLAAPDHRRPGGHAPGHRQGGRHDRPADGDDARLSCSTDAPLWANDLQDILADAVEHSFNCLSVEGHASTNDTVLLLSSTAATDPILQGDDVAVFAAMVRSTCETLARAIADDGEGATHFITIDVEGCETFEDARAIARAVADSPLVKTAIHGADPNWGRIVSAAGYSGVPFEEERALALDQRRRRLSRRHAGSL